MNSKALEAELQQIDPAFTVVENPNRPGLSNIFYQGKNYDLPVVSTNLIKDEPDPDYRYEFPNGMMARFWAKSEIMPRVHAFLATVKAGSLDELYE